MQVATCFHCGLPIPDGADFKTQIKGEEQAFCCIGCMSVCSMIHDSGLDGFYRRTPEDGTLAPPPTLSEDIALYDLDEVQEEFISRHENRRGINLLVEGIHCAACVWLIEKTLEIMPGVYKANVNLSGKRLHLEWDQSEIKLSEVMHRLSEVGYSSVPFDPEVAEGRLNKQNRAMLFRMAFAGFTAMNLMWISIALYSGADEGEFRQMFHWIGLALSTPTLLYSGWPMIKGTITGLRRRHLTMDLPIVIGAGTTYLYSSYITLFPETMGEVYFDTVVNFIFIILIGRYLEGIWKRHAVSATQRLMDLQPRLATVLEGQEEKVLAIRAVKKGQTVLIKAGNKVPVDGEILDGRTSVDESMLSGESEPVSKLVGDSVSAGTVNISSAIQVRVTGTLADTALGRIINLVEEAQASKAPIQCTADRIVPWFVLATLALATFTFLYWWNVDFDLALLAATSVLIITCPCAFGMATPMSIAVASGQGASHGILVKNGAVLETLSSVQHVLFDKTGTLTMGRMQVVGVQTLSSINESRFLQDVASIERYSEHSIAQSIVQEAQGRGLNHNQDVKGFESKPGYGVRASTGEVDYVIGTASWLRVHGIEESDALLEKSEDYGNQAVGVVHVGLNGKHCGLIAVADDLRPDAVELVQDIKALGLGMTMVSGDRRNVAEAIAAKVGGMEVVAEVLPEDKDSVVRELQNKGLKVAMVGDGVNDAPALIRADVGIAIGSGTDASMESADIVLISDELKKISLAMQLSQRTLRTIRQNIGISFVYNIIMVPLAMMAFVTPLVAAISMPISSLLVISNAARIRTVFRK